jgi:hypothetical protein
MITLSGITLRHGPERSVISIPGVVGTPLANAPALGAATGSGSGFPDRWIERRMIKEGGKGHSDMRPPAP